jgi:hypothetical protein
MALTSISAVENGCSLWMCWAIAVMALARVLALVEAATL